MTLPGLPRLAATPRECRPTHHTQHPFGRRRDSWLTSLACPATQPAGRQGSDRNSVGVFADTFRDWDQSRQFTQSSPESYENPMGTPVDADQLVAARQAGIPVAELHRLAYAGKFQPVRPIDPRVPLLPATNQIGWCRTGLSFRRTDREGRWRECSHVRGSSTDEE